MFVRPKKVKGNTYYQLVRSFREDGKVKQQFLCHLGRYKSLEAAIATERELAEKHERAAATHSEIAQDAKDLCLEEYAEEIEEMGGDFPSRRQAYLRWRTIPGGQAYLRWRTISGGHAWQDANALASLIDAHHYHRNIVRQEEKRAAAHRTRLNKFLECKRKYF
jgi:hypothetical protein